MKHFFLVIGFMIGSPVFVTCDETECMNREEMASQNRKKELIKIVLIVDSKSFSATLFDNPTSRSFADQLPMEVDLEDYADTEKIFYPSKSLSKEGAPEGAKPVKGDIMYYAPWGDIAIFYKDFGYASGLIPLGVMEDIDGFNEAVETKSEVLIEIVKN